MYYTDEERDKLTGWLAYEPGRIENYTPEEIKANIAAEKWPLITVDRNDADIYERTIRVYRDKIKDGGESIHAYTDAVVMVGLVSLTNYGGKDIARGDDGLIADADMKRINWKMKNIISALILTGKDAEDIDGEK